jgi:mono/diheme cytochrome c family protein
MKISKIKWMALAVAALWLGGASSQAGWFSTKKKDAAPTNPPPPVVAAPVVVAPPPPPPAPVVTNLQAALAWDADVKEYHPELGEPTAGVSFNLTNVSPVAVVVKSVTTSCGCTTAHLPPMPWTNAPGATGKIDVTVNLAGKTGTLIKTATVTFGVDSNSVPAGASPTATKQLQIRVFMPDPQAFRQQNQQVALADRQAVFKGNCAHCHADPAAGKTGEALYHAVCGVCHDDANRASMVADLHNLKVPTSRDFWHTWIVAGKPDSLMPAFSKAQGGPLTDDQINSVVDYLVAAIPSIDAATNAPAPAPAH